MLMQIIRIRKRVGWSVLAGHGPKISRRTALGAAAVLGLGAPQAIRGAAAAEHSGHGGSAHSTGDNNVVGEMDYGWNGFDPHAILTDFDFGEVKQDDDGRTTREWIVTAPVIQR